MRWSDTFSEELRKALADVKSATGHIASESLMEPLRRLMTLSRMISEERAFAKLIMTMPDPPKDGVVLFHQHIYDGPDNWEFLSGVGVSIGSDGKATGTFPADAAAPEHTRDLEASSERVVYLWPDGDVQIVWPFALWTKPVFHPESEKASTPVVMKEKPDAKQGVPIGFEAELANVGRLMLEAGARLEKLSRLVKLVVPTTEPPMGSSTNDEHSGQVDNRQKGDKPMPMINDSNGEG